MPLSNNGLLFIEKQARELGTERNGHTFETCAILRFLLVGLGMGVFQSPNNSAIMGSASKDKLGVVSGILAITRSLGQTTGIALLGSIWAGLVFTLSGNIKVGSVTSASPQIQVIALKSTFVIVVLLITLALIVASWAWVKENKQVAICKLTTL